MRTLALLACALALVSTPSLAQDGTLPPAQIAGGAAGTIPADPVPDWAGPNAVDFAGGEAPDAIGHAAYRVDRMECGRQIGALGRHWDTGGILRMTAQGGVQGAASSAPAAAINPLVVPIAAIGGAGAQLFNAITNNLGFFTNDAEAQITKCMDRRSIKSGMYTVTE